MILDVAELRAFGQVCRHVENLEVRRADTGVPGWGSARREGMRISTLVIKQTTGQTAEDSSTPPGGDMAINLDADATELVFAVRTDLPQTDPAVLAHAANRLPAPPSVRRDVPPNLPAAVASLTNERSRRAGHPCTDPHPDPG